MSRWQCSKTRRAGAIVPLTAIMLIVIMAFLALSIDLGYMILVHSQLQNAADAAALAGASQLLDKRLLASSNTWQTVEPLALTNARTQAQTFSQANYGGGVSLTLDGNANNSPTGDIVAAYLANPYSRTSEMAYDKYP